MREVHKFGGTSVGSLTALEHMRKIVTDRAKHLAEGTDKCEVCVVVSAMGKTTDKLVALLASAQQGDNWKEGLEQLRTFHNTMVDETVPAEYREEAHAGLTNLTAEIETVLNGVVLLEEASDRTSARMLSFGEQMSAFLVHFMFRPLWPGPVEVLDARRLILTDMQYMEATVKQEETAEAIQQHFAADGVDRILYIIPGFISGCGEETTLLGRGGSDYTASIFGAALGVDEVIIWTDVEGVKTADPRQVEGAQPVATLSFEEAMEISFFGAKIIYGPTMGPAMRARIQMRVKSTFDPDAPGTIITAGKSTHGVNVQCITSLSRVSVVYVNGCGMVGVTGVSARLFGALHRHSINVVLISQASSEHSICLCVARESGDAAKEALEEEFKVDVEKGEMEGVELMPNHSIIAVVGEVASTPGILGKVAGALGEANINIACLAQGWGERNISCVVKHEEERAALNAIHDAFFS